MSDFLSAGSVVPFRRVSMRGAPTDGKSLRELYGGRCPTMKPDYLPLFRDAGRLLMPDLAEILQSRAAREKRHAPHLGKQAFRLALWPTAKWWRTIGILSPNSMPESRHPSRDRAVFDAWERLGAFCGWDIPAFADALYLLIETPAVEGFCRGEMPEEEGDPRPWLNDREQVRAWLVAKAAFWHVGIEILVREGRLRDVDARRLIRHRPTLERCPDPYALVHFHVAADLRSIRWAERTARSSLVFFRGGSLRQVRAAALVVEELMEESRNVTLVQRFLMETNSKTAATWLAFVGAVRSPARRRHFLERLAAEEARGHSPHRVTVNLIQRIEQRARRHGRGCLELAGLFTIVRHGLDPAVIEEGFTLVEALTGSDVEVEIPDKVISRPPLEPLVGLGRNLRRRDRSCPQSCYCSGTRTTLRLWKASLLSPDLCREIAAASWLEFPESAARDWVRMLLDVETSGEKRREKRSLINRLRSSILGEAVEHRAVKAAVLRSLLSYGSTTRFREHLDDFETFAATVAKGFKKVPHEAVSLFDDFYTIASTGQRRSLARLPRAVIKHLEEAARSHLDLDRIQDGAKVWFGELPEVDPALLFRRPKRFLDALRELGGLPRTDASLICCYLKDHPGYSVDPTRIDLRDACFLFDTLVNEGETDPIPGKLRQFACGRISLGKAALEHYREEFANSLADCGIDLLRREIRRVEDGYRKEGLDPHTIRFLATLGTSNRRALKRFLNAIRSGEDGYRDAHPANRAWLAQRRHLVLDPWTRRGAEAFPVQLPGIAGAFVRLEDDPQEELKMGSYVDTCLSAGGCNQHGAVANTLDINKRVAYLRDENGRILGRQLLAISEEEELVPFTVYFTQSGVAAEDCERAFREFDLQLAGILCLPLRRKDGAYSVRALVAKDWYDDGAWDVEAV